MSLRSVSLLCNQGVFEGNTSDGRTGGDTRGHQGTQGDTRGHKGTQCLFVQTCASVSPPASSVQPVNMLVFSLALSGAGTEPVSDRTGGGGGGRGGRVGRVGRGTGGGGAGFVSTQLRSVCCLVAVGLESKVPESDSPTARQWAGG